ncbi:MAG: helix-turn-helix transcriptional regulator [Spirochaetales bacterium]|nr:helix-turn-helix transcriptional regulator [Spirochaetales bacterium]
MPEVQELKKERRRRAIIRASLRVFSRKGYETTALDEVAREARLAKGTLYLYFKDKEDLYFHAMLAVLERLETFVTRRIVASRDPLDRMKAIALAQVTFFAENPNYFRLFTAALNPEMASIHRKLLGPFFERRRRLDEYLYGLVEEGKSKNMIRGDIDTRDVVSSYVGMVNQAIHSVCMSRMDTAGMTVEAIGASGKDMCRMAEGFGEARESSPAERVQAIMEILLRGIEGGAEGGNSG